MLFNQRLASAVTSLIVLDSDILCSAHFYLWNVLLTNVGICTFMF